MKFRELQSPMEGIRAWGAYTQPYQFLITLDRETKEYRCSWKHYEHVDKLANHFDQFYPTWDAAMAACKKVAKELRQKH